MSNRLAFVEKLKDERVGAFPTFLINVYENITDSEYDMHFHALEGLIENPQTTTPFIESYQKYLCYIATRSLLTILSSPTLSRSGYRDIETISTIFRRHYNRHDAIISACTWFKEVFFTNVAPSKASDFTYPGTKVHLKPIIGDTDKIVEWSNNRDQISSILCVYGVIIESMNHLFSLWLQVENEVAIKTWKLAALSDVRQFILKQVY